MDNWRKKRGVNSGYCSYLVEAGVFLGHPSHADGAADARQTRFVRREEMTFMCKSDQI